MMYAVRAAYGRRLYDCIFDLKNAFQNTVADPEPDNPDKPHLYADQAPGFVEFGIDENGREIELVCQVLMGQQGRVDASKLFGDVRDSLLAKAHCIRNPMDPLTWLYLPKGMSETNHTIDEILDYCDEQELANAGKSGQEDHPPGYAIILTHCDDGPCACEKQRRSIDFVVGTIETLYVCNYVPWAKNLGTGITVRFVKYDDPSTYGHAEYCEVELDCYPMIQSLMNEHLTDSVIIQPRHITTEDVMKVGKLEVPEAGSPERVAHDLLGPPARSLKGSQIWMQQAYPQLKQPINRLCGVMASPTPLSSKLAKVSLMHIAANPDGLIFGGPGCHSLTMKEVVPPYKEGQQKSPLHHVWVDSNLEIKSITGGVQMLALAAIETTSQRQQSVSAAGSHGAEIPAAMNLVAKVLPVRDTLCFWRIPQYAPVQVFCDSETCVKVSGNLASVKKHFYLLRHVMFIRDAVMQELVSLVHVPDEDNMADTETKYKKYEVWRKQTNYKINRAPDFKLKPRAPIVP